MQIFEIFGDLVLRDHNVPERLRNLNNTVERVRANMQLFGGNLQQMGSNLVNVGSSLYNNVSKPLINIARDSVMLRSDLTEAFNVVDVTFGKSAQEVKDWSTTLLEKFGMVQLESINYVGSMGAMLKSSGLSAKSSKDMSKSLVELTGDMSSFYNLSHDETWEKIRAGISGETEPLKALGINMSVANLEAYALSQGIEKAWKNMSQSEQVMLRYNYLMKVSSDSQGDFARTSDNFANRLRVLSGEWSNLKLSMGTLFLPYAEKALDIFVKLKMTLSDIPGIGKIGLALAGLGIIIGPLIVIIGGLVAGLGAVVAIVGALGGPITIAIGIIGLLTPVFIALGAGAIYVWNKLGLLKRAFDLVRSAIQFISLVIKGESVDAMNLLTEKFGLTSTQAVNFIAKIVEARNALVRVGRVMKDTAKLIMLIFANDQQAVIDNLVKKFGMSKKEALEFAKKMTNLKNKAIELANKIKENVITVVGDFMDVIKKASKYIVEHRVEIARAIGKIIDFGSTVLSIMSKVLGSAGKVNTFAKRVYSYIKSGIAKAKSTLQSFENKVNSVFTKVNNFAGRVQNAFNGIKDAISGVINKISNIKFPSPPSWLPGFAKGVTNFGGGLAVVGEEGPEIVQLPRGSNVIPNNRMQQYASNIKDRLTMIPQQTTSKTTPKSIILNLYNTIDRNVDVDSMMDRVVEILQSNRVLKNE